MEADARSTSSVEQDLGEAGQDLVEAHRQHLQQDKHGGNPARHSGRLRDLPPAEGQEAESEAGRRLELLEECLHDCKE